ncbi:MAG TPA: glutamine-hydrolyzing GMP synthase, partial [Oscillospiraceae bacterium]|nr:glutamine-hydrolyzing GMP synthase [Oscillospiraceae bacterium]
MELLAILDCGGQYTKVIDRKVRELGVKSEIFPVGVAPEKLRGFGGIILSGGPASVWSESAPSYDPGIFSLGVPVLGICYGMHLMNVHFGGKVVPGLRTEYGETEIDCDLACPLFAELPSPKQTVLMSHGDSCETLAEGFSPMAMSGAVIAGIWSRERNFYGVQFHPEVDLTENGRAMLQNFLRRICGFVEHYTLEGRIRTSVDMIRSRVGDRDVLVLVSGGVDSAVTAALLLKALPAEQVHGIHIDHGFMRKNESDLICEQLRRQGLNNLLRLDAEDVFLDTRLTIDGKRLPPLSEVTDPETKRLIIGNLFIQVTRTAAESLGLDFDKTFLAQGTL